MKLSRRGFLAVSVAGTATCGSLGYFRACHYPGAARFAKLAVLSPAQGVILAALVDTILPPAAPHEAAAVDAHVARIDAYLVGLPAATQTSLGQALYAIEHTTLAYGGHLRRFSNLGRAARTEVLADWQTAGLESRRHAFRAVSRLVYLSHFTDAAAFAAIGYPGPSLPAGGGNPEQRARYDALLAPAGAAPRGRRA